MWPFSIIKKARRDSRLREQCISELRRAAKNSGVPLCSAIGPKQLDQEQTTYPGHDQAPIVRSLVNLLQFKRDGVPYTIDFVVEKSSEVSSSYEYATYARVGETPNPDWVKLVDEHKGAPQVECPRCGGYGDVQVSSENGVPPETCPLCGGTGSVEKIDHLLWAEGTKLPKKTLAVYARVVGG